MAEENNEVKTFTQDELNEIVSKEKAKVKARFKEYDSYKEKADLLKERESEVEELKKTLAGKDTEFAGIEKEVESLRHEKEVAGWKSQIAKETGVPTTVLRGDTEEELKAHAEQLKSVIGYPKVDRGETPTGKGFKEEKSKEDLVLDKISSKLGEII